MPAERLRVLQLIARLNVGGPATQVLALAEGLDPTRFEVRVATGVVDSAEADYLALRAPDLPVDMIPGLGRALRSGADARALAGIAALVRRFRPHVVHTHTAKAGMLGRLVSASYGLPTVHTFHGHLLHGYFGPSATRGVVTAERWLASRTDRLITVGERVRDELLAAGVGRPERYLALPPGVDAPDAPARREARRRLDIEPGRPTVAFVGRLTRIKRPDRLLEAFAEVQVSDGPPLLLVAGDGEMRSELELEASRRDLPVRFLGWRGDVGTIHAAADVAVLTSDNEGMPVSLIEAAHCGVPAVATDVGSVREVVIDGVTGALVPTDAAAVAEALTRWLADPERLAAAGSAARDRARERFSTAGLAAATAAVYEDVVLVGGRAGRRSHRGPREG